MNILHSPAPHFKSSNETSKTMLNVIIALMPAVVVSVVLFGFNALSIIFISIFCCLISELLFNILRKEPITVLDLSCVVTGLIFALNLSSETPLWVVALGAIFSIIIGKMIFGGIGKNIVNPAILGRIFVFFAFSTLISVYIDPADGVAGATALAEINAGNFNSIGLMNLIWGNVGGCLGETSAIAIGLGFIYLVITKTIRMEIPLVYILSAGIFSLIFTSSAQSVLPNILSGGLLFCAVFMATDYTTSPKNFWGRIIFAFMLGLLTMVFRQFSSLPEGVSFALLFMNLFVPLLDKIKSHRCFGEVKNV